MIKVTTKFTGECIGSSRRCAWTIVGRLYGIASDRSWTGQMQQCTAILHMLDKTLAPGSARLVS